MEHIIEKLKHMKDNEEEDREVRKLAEAKLKDKEAMLKELEAEPSKMYDDAKPHLARAPLPPACGPARGGPTSTRALTRTPLRLPDRGARPGGEGAVRRGARRAAAVRQGLHAG